MNGRTVCMLLALAVALLPATASGNGFPGAEEIQAVVWQASPTSDPDIRAAGAGISATDVAMPANADTYVAGKVGLTNFTGHTNEAGVIKFCTSALVGTCSLRPYGAFMRPGFFQRNIDTSLSLGSVVYSYNVFRPDPTNRPYYWAASWSGRDRAQILLTSEAVGNLSGFQNVFTAGASIGPWWGSIKVQGWGYTVGATTYGNCYAGDDARNTLNAATKGTPLTSRCGAGGPGVAVWEHVFARRVAVPIVRK